MKPDRFELALQKIYRDEGLSWPDEIPAEYFAILKLLRLQHAAMVRHDALVAVVKRYLDTIGNHKADLAEVDDEARAALAAAQEVS